MLNPSFFNGYIVCALWSSTDNADESGGEPLDRNYSASDIAPECLAQMQSDCEDFITANGDALFTSGLDSDQAGQDFWLSRNGHGAGFFDRGSEEVFRDLQQAARVYGSCDLYVGDDGKIYCS